MAGTDILDQQRAAMVECLGLVRALSLDVSLAQCPQMLRLVLRGNVILMRG